MFALKSDVNLCQALLDGYERHTWSAVENTTKRRRLDRLPTLKLVVMSNDTIATFISLAYSIRSLPANTRVVMGLVHPEFGDICAKDPSAAGTLVSTEWTHASVMGPLIDLGIVTEWDRQLDIHSSRPGFQPFEYMVGGKYIGELVHIICYDWFCKNLNIPDAKLPLKLVKEYALSTEFDSLTVASSKSDEELAKKLLKELPPPLGSDWKWTSSYAHDIRTIAWMVQNRAAALVAAAVIGLFMCTGEIHLRKAIDYDKTSPQEPRDSTFQSSRPACDSGPEELVVAYSGGVMQHYPFFGGTVQRYIDQFILRIGPQEKGRSVILREATDGGIVGTGVLAGIVSGEIKGIIGSS